MDINKALDIIEKVCLEKPKTLMRGYDEIYYDESFRVHGGKVMLYLLYPEVDENCPVKLVSQIGGENQGNYYAYVFEVSNGNDKCYVRYEARYNSWDGLDWTALRKPHLVYPKEKVVIEYVEYDV